MGKGELMARFDTVLDRMPVNFSADNDLRKGTVMEIIKRWNERRDRKFDLGLIERGDDEGTRIHEFVVLGPAQEGTTRG